jgi:riboflavin kinase/FMN adenylyltransferase
VCGAAVVLVTFDPHPASVAGRPRDTRSIVGLDERARLARLHGADHVVVLPFDGPLAATTAGDFVRDVLVDGLHATHVVVGENFRFGRGGVGDTAFLREAGGSLGFTAHGVPLLPGCSSTRVRSLIADGELATAAWVLGRAHRLRVRAAAGRTVLTGEPILPPPGTYRARLDGLPKTIEIGTGPHLRMDAPAREGDLVVELVHRIRCGRSPIPEPSVNHTRRSGKS